MMRKPVARLALALIALWLAPGCASTPSDAAHDPAREQAPVTSPAPYRVKGKTYQPLADWRGYEEEGMASWYGSAHHGRKTANGETFDAYRGFTAAHKTLPFNVCARIENLKTQESVMVRINDRGPFAKDRVIDVSRAAADEIGLIDAGVARVRVEAIGVAGETGQCESD
jgi:rare lipoprotein A